MKNKNSSSFIVKSEVRRVGASLFFKIKKNESMIGDTGGKERVETIYTCSMSEGK